MILTVIPWLTVFMGATIMFLAGKARWRKTAWYLGVLNQFLWGTFAVTTRTWGLVAGCFLYGGVYIRNILRGD